MRPFHFLLFLLFAQKITVAQNQYIPMVKEGKYWFISQKEITGQQVYYLHTFNGDSIVNNNTYKKLMKYGLPGFGTPAITTYSYLEALVREDTAARKVYQILTSPIVPSCTSEHIMYDFSLNIGDTLEDCNLSLWPLDKLPNIKIDTTFFETIGNKNRRGLTYTALTLGDFLLAPETFTYFEGYGYGSYGVMLRDAWCYQYCEGSLDDCNIILANNVIEHLAEFHISPNPISNSSPNLLNITYRLPASFSADNLDLCITDLPGRLVEKHVLNAIGDATVDISSLSNGVYLVQLRSKGVVLAVEKLVVMRAN